MASGYATDDPSAGDGDGGAAAVAETPAPPPDVAADASRPQEKAAKEA